jgi:guanine deaminase
MFLFSAWVLLFGLQRGWHNNTPGGCNAFKVQIFKGDLIFTPTPRGFKTLKGGYIAVSKGRVEGVYEKLPASLSNFKINNFGRRLIMPGFVDLHVHASQFYQAGVGLDQELLPWLDRYIYPLEERFADPEFARKAYARFVEELIRHGTLRACIFATVHRESTALLFDLLASRGIGAFVGKVNMDCHAPPGLQEVTAISLQETERLIRCYGGHPLVKPIITPRFAPSATPELLAGLGSLARKYHLPVQSHLAENKAEVAWVRELFPDRSTYAHVYHHYGLLGPTPTLMAHAVHLTEQEKTLLAKNSAVRLVHCPEANINLKSGMMPVRELLERGINLGLGSDIGAGHSIALYRVMVRAIQLSKIRNILEPPSAPLTTAEVFYLGTKGGGNFFGKVGSFEPGYAFDAIVVEDEALITAGFTLEERLQKFIYTGGAGNIVARFVEGRRVVCRPGD